MLKMTVAGHLGQNAKVNKINDKTVINFSVPHTERVKLNNEVKEITQWIACSYWTDKTKVAEYLTKGRLILVEGVPFLNSYANKEGVKMTSLNLRVSHIELLGKNTGTNENTAVTTDNQQNETNFDNSFPAPAEDDLPF